MNTDETLETLSTLECKPIVRLLEILARVDSRVSSGKEESSSRSLARGLIDKLVLKFEHEVSLQDCIAKARKHSCEVQGKYLRDKKYYVSFESKEGAVFRAHLRFRDNDCFDTITINPSHFQLLLDLEIFVDLFFPSMLSKAVISRIDFSVDIFDDFNKVIRGVDFTWKSARTEFTNNRSFTGLMVGKGNDKVIVYDKMVESNVVHPWTRIERQLSGRKVPVRKYRELRGYLEGAAAVDIFSGITLSYVEFCRPSCSMSLLQEEMFHDLKSLVIHSGIFQARKKLNKNKNFKRDYSKFFLLIPYQEQLPEVFKVSMNDYLGGKNGK